MIIHDYTVILAKQTLNTTKTAKDNPYFYDKKDIDLRELTNQELNKLYLEAQSIETQLQTVMLSRG